MVEKLFDGHFDIPSNEINVIPQSYQKQSNPDGEISCDSKYNIFIESKIVPNAINETQLLGHMALTNPAQCRYLIYLTPDSTKPKLLQLHNVEWMSWETILEKLAEIVESGLASELLKYLIDQFTLLVRHVVYNKKQSSNKNHQEKNTVDEVCANGIDADQRVIVVGGSWGEEVALEYSVYLCQPYRYFKPARYIAFYHQNRIKYLFEILGQPKESVDLKSIKDFARSDYLTKKEPHYAGDPRKYFKLKLVKEFCPEIVNDKTSHKGSSCAFTQKQTYTTYNRIMNATKTSEL